MYQEAKRALNVAEKAIAQRDTCREENRRLRDALQQIAKGKSCNDYYCHACGCQEEQEDIARAALEAK